MLPINAILDRLSPLTRPLFARRQHASAPVLPGSALAIAAWNLAIQHRTVIVVVTDGPSSLEAAHQDLRTLAPRDTDDATPQFPLYYPARDALDHESADPELVGQRLGSLLNLQRQADAPLPRLLATNVQALMQPAANPAALSDETLTFAPGTDVDSLEQVIERLVKAGYTMVPQVQEKGEAAHKGGLLDLWPPTEPWPVRIDFFDTTVDSLRAFDPFTQRSVSQPDKLAVPAVDEFASGEASLLNHLPADAIYIWSDMDTISEHADRYLEHTQSRRTRRSLTSLDALLGQLGDASGARHLTCRSFHDGATDIDAHVDTPHVKATLAAGALDAELLRKGNEQLAASIRDLAATDHHVVAWFDSPGSLTHFRNDMAGEDLPIDTREGILSDGFTCDAVALTLLTEADLYGRKKAFGRRYHPLSDTSRAPRLTGDRVADLDALSDGDLVIHIEHGLGRYEGLNEILVQGRRQEVISITYAEGARLHVPVAHAHLLSRYVAVGRKSTSLHRLGGRRWDKERTAAEQAIADLAAQMLETQAQRSLLEGHPCAPDTPWQREFEAAFPYHETTDQVRAIEEVKTDMEAPRPMDRLICGDAGYGKTEVAMRAAFKTVMDGRQVAVLVPTTVLAQQHFQTFRDRMGAYPLRIEMLSRFITAATQRAILEDLTTGSVDIVIGTHSLVQPNVRFHNLGLAIIDEEQRFGVAHKERLKEVRRLVDVITMTATPIPRTLHMSLSGARDLSLLQTAPRERQAIETIVAKDQDARVRKAILRELDRDGQVYYLHNRVMTIERARERLMALVPEARIAVAHGQMPPNQLRGIMRQFVAGEFDVLLCTTIIESGMDIPRANTIIIDRADRFGIADLYQLRGRVGRSTRKAFAFLLLPPHGHVDADARERIAALRRHTALGSGLNLALKDLEIRGAGNLLGRQQSGHIAAIGFGLYCQLLERTVARLKGDTLPAVVDVDVDIDFAELSPASDEADAVCLPYAYIDDDPLRMQMYRRVAQISALPDIDALREELTDRFGPPPAAVTNLLTVAEIRVRAQLSRLQRVRVRSRKVRLQRGGEYLMRGSRFPRLQEETVEAMLAELRDLVAECAYWSAETG